ncbi:hypothetical protein [Aeromicrobium sp. Root344]|uniref:hypothetical protein n=1 Tax=Aeromicrobium sp. Root344 TaxID=1736521 RepID=UPI0012FAC182|nr:hypothetical protein [Aeromicrobium sp. Root344]
MTDQAIHAKSYVCTHVFDGARPVLYVTRPDGDWCFLCGGEHPDNADAYRVVGMNHVVEDDRTLIDVLDLDTNEEAERRSVGDDWVRSMCAPD